MVDSVDSADLVDSVVEWLTQVEYAKRIGVSKQRVNRMVRDGKIQLHNRKIDPVEADLAVASATHGSYAHNVKNTVAVARRSSSSSSTEGKLPPPPDFAEPVPDDLVVEEIYRHLKTMIFNGRDIKDIPHIEIKKLNEFIGAVQKKREMDEHARILIPMTEARDQLVQTGGQIRESLLNIASRVAGTTSAKAMEFFAATLSADSLKDCEGVMQGKQWEDIFYQSINGEVTEALRALSTSPIMLR